MIDVAFAMGGGAREGGGSPFGMMVPLLLIFGVFYFLLIRPSQKKEKARQIMLSNLKKGDRVITQGGIHGSVVGIKGEVVVLKVAENIKMEFSKSAISLRMGEGEQSK